MLKALVFDVDGTLAETEELHRRAFNKAFASAGLDWYWSRGRYADLLKVTGGKERIAHFLKTDSPPGADNWLDANKIASLHAAKTRCYGDLMASGAISLRPGIAALINEALAKGLRLAIATTTTRANVEALFAATLGDHMLARFDAVCCAEDAATKKPAPDIYFSALSRLGLKADRCLALEDSANGVRSAVAAGLRVVVTPALYTRDDDFTGALVVIDDLETGRFRLADYLQT